MTPRHKARLLAIVAEREADARAAFELAQRTLGRQHRDVVRLHEELQLTRELSAIVRTAPLSQVAA